MPGEFERRSILITGGASGIGAELARRYCAEGANVFVLTRDRSSSRAATLEKVSPRLCIVEGDLSETRTCQNFVDAALSATGRIDVLINAAANRPQLLKKSISELSISELESAFNIHLKATYGMCIAAWSPMKRGGFGRVVNFASGHVFGSSQDHGMIPYSISKAGVIGLTRALAHAARAEGIAANAIFPAAMDGQWNRSEWNTPSEEQEARLRDVCSAESVWPLISQLTSARTKARHGQLFSQCNDVTTRVVLADGPNMTPAADQTFDEFMEEVVASKPQDCPPSIGAFFSKHLGSDRSRALAVLLHELKNPTPS